MRVLFSLLLIAQSVSMSAQEVWIHPNKYNYNASDYAFFQLKKNIKTDNLMQEIDSNSIKLFTYYAMMQNVELPFSFILKNDSIASPSETLGTQMVALEYQRKQKEISAIEFHKILKENKLVKENEESRKSIELQAPVKVNEIFCLKSVFQQGKNFTLDFLQKTSLSLDIIPIDNPYNIANLGGYMSGSQYFKELQCKIYCKGELLKKAKVTITRLLNNGGEEEYETRTNKQGEVTMQLLFPGEFIISCTYLERDTNTQYPIWNSYFGSLSFGAKGNFFTKRKVSVNRFF